MRGKAETKAKAKTRTKMSGLAKAPGIHDRFVRRFPALGRAWELSAEAGETGPLDAKTRRLVKLAVAMGALREGAVHSSVRKALAVGCSGEELDQVVALAAGTIGFPSAVALFSWVHEEVDKQARRPKTRRSR